MTDGAIDLRRLRVLGVDVADVGADEALSLLERALARDAGPPVRVYFVNAHTLKLASEDAAYREVLAAADYVFGDGTGVRWAVRYLYGRPFANVNGTDLTPAILGRASDPPRGCFLLGATEDAIPRAAAEVQRLFPGWRVVGHHHGYVPVVGCGDVIDRIDASGADLLLVGMGNPKQETWIHENAGRLGRVRLCMAVGGLFDYWAGDLDRAPAWMRSLGIEWLHLMLRQPRKVHRYLVGGPQYLLRVARSGRQPSRDTADGSSR